MKHGDLVRYTGTVLSISEGYKRKGVILGEPRGDFVHVLFTYSNSISKQNPSHAWREYKYTKEGITATPARYYIQLFIQDLQYLQPSQPATSNSKRVIPDDLWDNEWSDTPTLVTSAIARIKTEDEFIAEYGSNWRGKVHQTFPKNMDHLLGKVISKKTYDLIRRNDYVEPEELDYYAISSDMVISESNISFAVSNKLIITSTAVPNNKLLLV